VPAGYVADHVELAYAATAYQAQGRTVDTAHALISPTTTREVLYVSATRGRQANRLYVNTSFDPAPETGHDPAIKTMTAADVLAGVLANERAELSAHEGMRQARAGVQPKTTTAATHSPWLDPSATQRRSASPAL
jgi:hypothetical protein